MKTFLCALLALLVGLVLGGWGPKSDLRKAREEIDQLKKQVHTRTSHAGLDGITSLLRIPEGGTPARTGAAKPAPVAVSVTVSTNTAATAGEPPRRRPRHRDSEDEDDPTSPDRQTLQERLKTASNLWKTRADLARNAFVSNVTTSGVQASQFDLAVADMNLRLGSAIREWADLIKQEQTLTPETGIRMMHALSSELVQTYDQFDETMPADWRTRAGEKFQVFDLIDPQVAMPLTEIEVQLRMHRSPTPPPTP
jgi:hypothetical protein